MFSCRNVSFVWLLLIKLRLFGQSLARVQSVTRSRAHTDFGTRSCSSSDQTVLVVILLSLDFWTVRNVSGRILCGLRFWNQVDDDGTSFWVFEHRSVSRWCRRAETRRRTRAPQLTLGLHRSGPPHSPINLPTQSIRRCSGSPCTP